MLQSDVDAALDEICEATCWQAHACQACLTDQRKKLLTAIAKASGTVRCPSALTARKKRA